MHEKYPQKVVIDTSNLKSNFFKFTQTTIIEILYILSFEELAYSLVRKKTDKNFTPQMVLDAVLIKAFNLRFT